jgi:FSR family fosmidomycin resistance protein-like MFS transporter
MVLACAAIWGWQGAFLFAAGLSFAAALLLIVAGSVLPRAIPKPAASATEQDKPGTKVGLDLLLSPAILRNLLFFLCLAMANGGIQTYAVVALAAIHGTPASVANIGLSGFLLMSAGGVLLGGIIADRTIHHERVAAVGFACTSTMAVLMGWADMPAALLIGVMSLGGLLNGMIQPSRDMMVRAVTPPGSFGKVFGFVSTGFNIGGMIAPLLYGWLMDRGQPRMIFAIVTVFIVLALLTAMTRAKPQGTPAWTR